MPKRQREGDDEAAAAAHTSLADTDPTPSKPQKPQRPQSSEAKDDSVAQPPSSSNEMSAASGSAAADAAGGASGGSLSVEGVCQWLVSIDCGSAVEAFRRHDIDGTVLAALTESSLKSELEIESYGIRTRVLLERGAAAASGDGEQGELTLQLEPVEEAASASGGGSERQRKRPAEIDVFSAPSPRLPSTPSNPGSGSAGTTVSASPSLASGPSSAASASSAGSSAGESDVTTLTDGDMGSVRSERPESAASTNVSSSPDSSSYAAAAGGFASSAKSPGVPRSPAFIMSPKLQGSLHAEQLTLRDRVQEGDAAGAQAVLAAAPAAAKKEWANTVDEQGFTLLMEAVALVSPHAIRRRLWFLDLL